MARRRASLRPRRPPLDAALLKSYDKAYFDRWYRDPRSRMWTEAAVARKVRLAVGMAEYLLERPIRSVLDVGCGEGSWQPLLNELRPRVKYLGVDASEYVVQRFGKSRNIRLGSLATLGELKLKDQYDLIVCCDVMHYVPTPELKRGVAAMAELAEGPAYLEAYTSADSVEGDEHGFQRRAPSAYRRIMKQAGFLPVGPHCYTTATLYGGLVALEKP